MNSEALLSALGNLTLERRRDGRFVRAGLLPAWCAALDAPALRAATPFAVADVFPFLDVFLEDAERAWARAAFAASGFWTEMTGEGEALHLQATALRVDDDALLIVCRSEERFEAQRRILQRARELRLGHDELAGELEQKDVLLHTLVHDLAAPLHRLLGTSALLLEQALPEPIDGWVRTLHDDLSSQQRTITALLEAFSAELEEGPMPRSLVDLRRLIDDVVAVQGPIAARRGVRLEIAPDAGGLVSADSLRARRVIDHLVGNAVHDSAAGTRVDVVTREIDGWHQLSVEDSRPALPLETVPRLFDRIGAVGTGSAAAVGLYFCRISAERWGGGIGYEPTAQGGRRFWVRFPGDAAT
jgi:signal transduction histidine kinase